MDMQVGKFFTLKECTVSQQAARSGIDNTPTEAKILSNMQATCKWILDPLREALNRPVVVTSMYRSPKVNKLVGGSKTSQHMEGKAADIIVPGCTVDFVVTMIEQLGLPFDQLIDEFGEWVHVSFNGLNNRKEILKARKKGKKTVYTKVK